MSNPAIEFAKRNPLLIGGVAVVSVIGIAFLMGGSGGGDVATTVSPSGTSDGAIAAGLQLQQISAAAQAAAGQQAVDRELGLATLAATVRVKELEAETAYNTNVLAAGVATKTLETQERVSSLQLAADAEKAKAEKETQIATIGALSSQATAATNASVKMAEIAARPKGLLSFLFG